MAMSESLQQKLSLLEKEIVRLKQRLSIGKKERAELESARQAMLYLLEDLNESNSSIKQAKQEWEQTFDAVSDPIFLHDKHGYVIRANRAYAAQASMDFDEIIGAPYWHCFPKLESPLAGCMEAVRNSNTPPPDEEIKLDDGRMFLSRSYAIHRDDGYLFSIHLLEDISERKALEKERERLLHDSGERVKELQCLYGISESIQMSSNIEDVFRDALALIPLAWQYPEVTCAVIRFRDQEYQSDKFKKTPWSQATEILVHGKVLGMVEVCYLEEMPDEHEGPFLKEEFDLINGIGKALGGAIERKQAKLELEKSYEILRRSLAGTVESISKAVEARDPYTAGHQRRVANLSIAIAVAMGLDEKQIEGIGMGASIHDIGKINLPAEILSKPTKISEIERSLIQGHCEVGYEILKGVEFPWPVADIVHQHHERIDGSGYPRGLKGDEICLEARIVAVADVVEAMASHRPYRAGLGIDAALEEVRQGRGIKFDSNVVDTCIKLFESGQFSLDGEGGLGS